MAFSLSRKWTIAIGIVLIAVLALTIRSCSSKKAHKEYYRIARNSGWGSIDLHGKEKNMLGFSDELLQTIAEREKIRIELVFAGNDQFLPSLDNRQVDGVMSIITPTVLNLDQYDFSEPYYLLGPVLIVRSSSPVHEIKQMKGGSIGILSGSSLIFNTEQYPSLLVTSYNNIVTALNDLEKNVIDGVLVDALTGYTYVYGPYAGKLRVATPPLTNEGFRLITRRDPESEVLIHDFNEGLEALRKDGTYEKLLEKWTLIDTSKPKLAEETEKIEKQ